MPKNQPRAFAWIQKAMLMVFCGMPRRRREYENLKEALGKLQLSDASLFLKQKLLLH